MSGLNYVTTIALNVAIIALSIAATLVAVAVVTGYSRMLAKHWRDGHTLRKAWRDR